MEITPSLNNLIGKINKSLQNGQKLKEMSSIMLSYKGTDWENFMNFCSDHYTRNLVYRDNNIEVLIICWNRQQGSRIHDHPENGCIVKLLTGKLFEELYDLSHENRPVLKSSREINANMISYQEGSRGLHKITNPTDQVAVSIHVYSPPNHQIKLY